ncbi:Threonine/homoserine efflux transporter RhtA [Arthrobacter subterraneus]|uniref:Threonine/homoserine efflux transporter RhtA n=1 Tax=Arthrobacter subterraneus TaxID=335973 RepID=A0A1G8L8U0_9MICC|nr:DMT family transporter [Arthrobacter subterraneus]SDI52032.1 Threonine/homoserine efflux transporter RhtA [Arthrobacter subterraneus]
MRSGTVTGLWFALLSAASFGVSGPFAKSLLEIGWSPGAAVGVRIGGAALVLAVPVIIGLRGRWGTLRRNGLTLIIYGATAIALCQFFYFSAVQRMSVGVSLLLEYLAPVLIVGWLWVRSRRAPSRLTVSGSAAAMLGLLLVLDLTGDQRLDPVGVLFGLGAAVCLAVFFVMSAKADDDLPPLIMAGGGMMVGALTILVLGLVGVMPFAFTFQDVTLAGRQAHWLVPVLVLVIIATVLAYFTGILAARGLGSKVASFVGLTEVMFAVLASWLILRELPSAIQLLGGALIVGGVILVRIDELRRMPDAADPLDQPNVVEPVPTTGAG